MEKLVMVKSEVQANGDIFLFYVDENGSAIENHGVTTIDQEQMELLRENYILQELPTEGTHVESTESIETRDTVQNEDDPTTHETNYSQEWQDEETEKLLIFYIDNKEAFQNLLFKKIHLWTVACKTMIFGKQPNECETKLDNLKKEFSLLYLDHLKNESNPKVWPFFELCEKAFCNDADVDNMIKKGLEEQVLIPTTKQDVLMMNKLNKCNKTPDEKVKQMLELYLQYKKEGINDYLWHKKVWEKIAIQIGEDADFWHKRFLNYKQHYIRALEKRKECGAESIVWPYMALFDEIFSDDADFKRKYGSPIPENKKKPSCIAPVEWNDTEKTVLVKYYFDCIGEFQDSSIPNMFLWNEVGRLLDKQPDECHKKFEQLKKDHLNLYIEDCYNLRNRKPIAILFDNIIAQEVERTFSSNSQYMSAADMQWRTEKIDIMVQFLFDNIEMLKDPICHYVCFAAVAVKIDDTLEACKEQWNDLTTLYKSILNDKKEDPDLQIDWRYIDMFDRIFDYGMDTKLLEGYEKKEEKQKKLKKHVLNEKPDIEEPLPDNLSDLEPEEFEDKSSGKRVRGIGDPKQIKILEYYLKYKDKFGTTQRKKQALWETLASNIGISAEQCAHRFRNLKQVYMAYIQREINKPDKPILWPYFAFCKKAFGYRQIKNKLKQGKMDVSEVEEWTPREIKILINYFGQNLEDSCAGDISNWVAVAKDINKSETACRDKFLDLRKSYRKIITMMGRNPDCKVNWKYFKFFDEIYSKTSMGSMEVDSADDNAYTCEVPHNAVVKTEASDNDLQCIIVIPEGEEMSNASSAQIIINSAKNEPQIATDLKRPWSKQDKIAFLQTYLQYIEQHQGKIIKRCKMLTEIGKKIDRSAAACNTKFQQIKILYKKKLKDGELLSRIKKTKVLNLMHKILAAAPKYTKTGPIIDDMVLNEGITYTDIELPLWTVGQALNYYLDHLEEFVSPKYDKKQAWINLTKTVPVKISKIFKKINYLKQSFNIDTNEVNGETFEYADLLKKILEKEFVCRIAAENIPEPMSTDEDVENIDWTDDETEQLLQYYLSNLDKFKNPIYVPSYLWMDASNALSKSAKACSKKMTEIRSQYSTMVKGNPNALNSWRFYELCQKIYGTGKKTSEQIITADETQ